YGKYEAGAITGMAKGVSTTPLIYQPFGTTVKVTVSNAQYTRHLWKLIKHIFQQRMEQNYNAKFTGGNNDYEIIQDPVFNMDISPPVGWTYFTPSAAPATAALFFVGQSNDTTTAKTRADTEIMAAMIEAMVDAQMPVVNVQVSKKYGRLEGGAITGTFTGAAAIVYVPYARSLDVTIRNAQTTRYTWNLVKNNFLQKMSLKYNAKFTGDVTVN
ncbi:hypothetical protein PMAYCL1PPCAC_04600, partial [Pristionchus mayeri]